MLGILNSPVAAMRQNGIGLPSAVQLIALPFKGVLVIDGTVSGHAPCQVNKATEII